jgi:hypothetical protein
MAKDVFTAEELGIAPASRNIFTAEELGFSAPKEKEIFTAEDLGLAAPNQEPAQTEPTVFQRVKDIAAAPIEAIMGKDAFKESAPTPSTLKGSVKKGFLNVEQSVLQNQLASLMDLQAADKEK